jgi:hypothetical protein
VLLNKINVYLASQGRAKYSDAGFCNGLVSLYFFKGREWLEQLLQKI